jgi:hypothetical protein
VAAFDVAEFLNPSGQGAAHGELLRLIARLFENTPPPT